MRILTFLVVLILIFAIGFFWFQISTAPASKVAEFKIVVITPGESLSEIAQKLKRQDIIKNGLAFRILAALSGLGKKIQAGSYKLSTTASSEAILKELTFGTFDLWVTIPEGLRVEEIGEILAAVMGIEKNEFLKVSKEGFMFPDTYLIPKAAKAPQIAKIMLDNFNRRVDGSMLDKIAKSGLTLTQVVILASIVEREVKFAPDRPIVAGILVKRFQEHLPLGADATVQYAQGFQNQENSWWKRNLTDADLEVDSPYNTRKFSGIPPGPICNPGLASIKAVVESVKTDFYYYLSDNQGKMYYAKTLEEHIENIRNYL